MGYTAAGRRLRAAALTVLAVTSTVLAAVPASAALPIVSDPDVLLAPRFVGSASTAAPLTSFPVPAHPYLAPDGTNSMHDDAYATDSYTGRGPTGRQVAVTSALYGLEECATVAFDVAGRLIGLCGNLGGPVLRLIDPVTLDVRGSYVLPGRDLLSGANPLGDLCGGAYFYLDQLGRAVVATTARTIQVVAPAGTAGFALQRTYDLTAQVPGDDCLIALLPDWSGRIWFESNGGRVGTVDPVTGAAQVLALPGEVIANSFSVDETGGVFIVSDHALYRFDADPDTGAPAITWRQPYDRGSTRKPGQLSQGSGTTPTLVGPDRVAITDNADPRMNVSVYERGAGSGGRPVCSEPVFAPGASATENSLVAVGMSLIVENNYGYTGPASTVLGRTSSPGIARVDVVDGHCTTAWTSNQVAPSSVPKVSLASGLLYVYTKPASPLLVDAWYFTAIDVRTGATVFSRLTGTGSQFNNHYAAIYLGRDGSAYVATLTGLLRIRDTA